MNPYYPPITQSYTISATSTHSSAYAANSFTATPSVYSIVGANSLSIAITGAEQATSTAPGCSSAGCKEILFGPSGSILAVVQNGALVKGTLPLPGGDTAIYNASGLNYLRHTDYLNSSRLATTWGHAVYSKVAYAPFGETYNEAGTPDRSFTGQDQDVVAGSAGSGVYDFLFRKYDPSAGRWLSPDPSGWGAVSLSAPQSLNRYAYGNTGINGNRKTL